MQRRFLPSSVRHAPNIHPLTKLLFRIMLVEQCSLSAMAEKAGFSRAALSRWRGLWHSKKEGKWKNASSPDLVNIDAAFQVVGKRLVIIDDDLLPAGVRSIGDIRAVAGIWNKMLEKDK